MPSMCTKLVSCKDASLCIGLHTEGVRISYSDVTHVLVVVEGVEDVIWEAGELKGERERKENG